MAYIKTDKQIETLREGGKHLSSILDSLESAVRPGVSTKDLDDIANKLIKEMGDVPILLGYKPGFSDRAYPATICASINDEIVHGIPLSERILKEGDIIGIDLSIMHDNMIVDSARTIPVGNISKEARKLIEVTREARSIGIAEAKVGNHVGDIGHAIEKYAKEFGYGVAEELCGHGVGCEVHEEPNVPNFGKPGTGPILEHGMVIAIEPMFNLGGKGMVHDHSDGYTCRTADGSISAHFEHTVAILDDGPEILTE